MYDPVHDNSFPAAPAVAQAEGLAILPVAPAASRSPRRAMLWIAGLAALLLAIGYAGRHQRWLGDGSGPGEIARAQIEDLGRGQVRAAYDLFSTRYREQVPFEEWREMALLHGRMFRTRELHFDNDQELGGRATLQVHVVAESGDRYLARFTLIRSGGRWWVDDLHWVREDENHGRTTV